MTRMSHVAVLVTLWGVTGLAQPPSTGAYVTAPALSDPAHKAIVAQLDEAVGSSTFASTSVGEFKLTKPIDLSKAAHGSGSGMRTIDYQVGFIGDKPAFATFQVPADSMGQTETALKIVIPKLEWKKTGRGDFTVQSCGPNSEPVCVERDSAGICTKTRCVPKGQ